MTGYEYVRLALKRFLSESRLDTNFLAYLRTSFIDGIARIFPSQGLFTFPVALTNNGDGTFTIGTDPADGTDGSGHILRLTGAARCVNVPFENGVGDRYWLGLHHIEIPSGVYTNPRTGTPEYDKTIEEVGVKGTPDAIVDMGGGRIRITVNSVFEAGVSNATRTVRVYLVNPISLDAAVAFEDVIVQYAAGNNFIETAGSLGQGTISVVAANYEVAALGVAVRKSVANPFPSDYAILGYVTGGGAAESVDDQVDLSGGGGHTLQKAYDGLGGLGSGRTITAENQAVVIRQENTTVYEHDVGNAALRIEKDMSTAIYPATPTIEYAFDIKAHPSTGGMIVVRVPLADYDGSDLLRVEEAINVLAGTDRIDFTRGAPLDLELTGLNGKLRESSGDMVEISGTLNSQDGLYWLHTIVDSNTLALRKLNGAAPVFIAEAGVKARIYRPIVLIGRNGALLEVNSMQDFLNDDNAAAIQSGLSINIPENETVDDAALKISRDGVGAIVTIDGEGNIDTLGDVDTHGSDVKLETGDIHMGANPADGGDIFMQDGTIANVGTIGFIAAAAIGLSMAGKTIDSCGGLDMTAPGGGGVGIDMNGTGIDMAGGDITMGAVGSGGDIHMRDGAIDDANSITITAGAGIGLSMGGKNIDNPTDVTISGGFKYNPSKTYHIIVEASDAKGDEGTYSALPEYQSGTSASHGQWVHGGGADDCAVVFPIHGLPLGAVVTTVDVLGINAFDDNEFSVQFMRLAHDWATPAVGTRVNIVGPTNSGVGAGVKKITLMPGGGHTVLDGNKYEVLVVMANGKSPMIKSVRVTYTLATIAQPV